MYTYGLKLLQCFKLCNNQGLLSLAVTHGKCMNRELYPNIKIMTAKKLLPKPTEAYSLIMKKF